MYAETASQTSARKAWNILVAFLFTFNMLFGAVPPAAAQAPSPTITTDKTDYQAGETVTVTGTDWQGDTTVRILANDEVGQSWQNDVTVPVAEDGSVTTNFVLPSYFVAQYSVVATGVQTGRQVIAYFTDAPALTLTKTASPLTYTAAGASISYTYTLKNTGTTVLNGPFTVTDNKIPGVTCPATATLAAGASITCNGTYVIQSADVTFGYVVNTATASSSNPGAVTSNTDVRIVSIPVDCRNDSDGANDVPGQKDLTMECEAPTSVNPLVISWNWDVITQPGGNSADACALFDTNNNGLANYAICVSWQNNRVMQAGYPVLYSCTDTRSDRCTGSTPITISNGSSCSLELASDDPFPAGDSYPQDTKAFCSINLADVGGAQISTLIDVCSYPSAVPNSDPSDCVVISAAKSNLEVIKSVVPNDTSTNWNMSWTGPTPYSTTITGSGTTGIQTVNTGTYNITEAAGTGTDLSLYDSTWACTVNGSPSTSGSGTTISGRSVAKGDVVICTFTNTRKTGSLEIKKVVTPSDPSTNWNFAVTGPDPTFTNCSIAGTGTCGAKTVFSGSYSITETAGTGTNLSDYGTSYACTVNGSAGPSGSGTTISGLTINKSDTVVCTFTNSQAPGTLTVNKVVVPSSDTGKFNLQIDGTTKASDVGDGGTTGAVSVTAGSHTVGEIAGTGTDLSNYVTTIAGDCDSSGNVSVSPNQNKTCTITNTRKGNIIIKKVTDPAGQAGDFTFSGAVSGTIQDGGTLTASNLAPGAYSVTETSLASDFSLESISCDDSNSTGDVSTQKASITLDPGETVTCTFTNKKLFPDLAVIKKADATAVTAGDPVGFNISVKNNGLGTAINVTLGDSLPVIPGVTWEIASQPGGNPCTLTGVSLSCAFGDLAPGATAGPVHVTGTSTAASCGIWSNTAFAQADNNLSVSGFASITVECATIKIAKTGNGPVSAGDPISFTITVTNDNSGTAHNVTVSDTLPTNTGLGAWTLSGTDAGACSILSGALTCNFGDVAGHGSKTVTLTAPTTAATCGDVNNTASVTTSNDGSDQSTATVTVQCPNLSVTKTPDAGTVNAGDPIGFTITVHNAGPGVAKSVTLTDTLPAGLTWTSTPGSPTCTITGQSLSCGLDDLASGADATVHVSATSSPATCGALTNKATATPTNGNASTSLEASITVNCADVTVTKTGNGPVSAGDTATFTVKVEVTGSGSLSNVSLSDPLPAGVTWSIDPSITACSITTSPQVLNCSWATLAAGTTIEIAVSGMTSQANCAAPLSNTATVAASNETDTTNDTGSASIAVQCATIKIEKTTTTPAVSAGTPINFTIKVSNPGEGTARNVTVTDNLPTTAGLVWTISPAVSGCSITGSVLTCNFGDIATNSSKSVTITSPTTSASCDVISNTASVTTTNDGSDQSSASVTVKCPDLTVEKTGNGPINAGDTAIYTIKITNNGTGDAAGVTLSDTLPAHIAWSVDNASCGIVDPKADPNVLSCNFGTLPAGESITIHVSGATSGLTCGSLSNTVNVAATNEAVTDNNSATGSVTVNCASIAITKTAQSPISAGDTLSYTITVSNNGDGTAYGVTVLDPLPTNAGLGPWTFTPGTPTCDIVSGKLSCALGDMPAHTSQTITLSSPTTYASCGTIFNEAAVNTTNDGNSKAGFNVDVQCPSLAVAKTADDGTVSAGDTIGFVITVTNNGDGVAKNVALSDTLPTATGISWSIASSDPTCSISGVALSCTFGNLAKGQSKSVHVTSPTTKDSCTTYNNTATASADNQPSITSQQASVTVQCTNIQITKTADQGPFSAGDTIGFTIEVTNPGPGTAYGVTITDTLPTNSGLDWLISPAVSQCAIASGVLTCHVGTLPANKGFLVHISSPTTAATCGAVENTAHVTTTNDGSGDAGDTLTVSCPDLTIAKTPDTGPFSAGDTIGFTITVNNNGTGKAYGVSLTDTLPTNSGLDWSINPTVSGCSISSGVLTCDVGALNPAASFSVHISSPTSPATCGGTVNNTATVTATNEVATGNNSAGGSITVNCPSLTVTKKADAASVSAGDTIGFTITVSNAGPGAAKSVNLVDTLPSGSGISWSLTGGTGAPYCQPINSGVLQCNFGDMAAGASYDIHVTSPTDATSCGTYNNTAKAVSANQADVTGTDSVTVKCASISITKTTDTPTVSAGDTIHYTLVVSNGGDGTAHGVTVTDILPNNAGLDWTVAPAVAGCSVNASVLTCNLGDLAGHTSQTITLTSPTTYNSCATLSNTASVTTSNDGSGNSPAATITVNCPSLAVTKTADDGTVSAGDPIGFVITVTNNGDGVAKNVQLSDTLPTATGISWSIASSDPTCSITGGALSCTFGNLAKGESKSVHVTSPTTKDSCTTYNNTATATADNQPSVTSSQVSITVLCAGITITKVADNETVSSGDTIGFTIEVTNPGPGTAYGVTITDTLPTNTGLDWTVDPAVSQCSIASGVLTCNVGTLPANKGFLVHISSPTTAATCGAVENAAHVTTTNDGSGDAGDTLTVSCPDLKVTKTAASGAVSAGDSISFTILVENIGAGTARDVTLSDTLPTGTGLAWSIGGPDAGASCEITGGKVVCAFGDLAPKATKTITLTSPTTKDSCATINNTATVTATNEPTGQPNNSSTASIDVLCATISIVKTPVPASGVVNAGDPIAFNITVSNTGAGTAKDVIITDTLPDKPGLSWTINSITPVNISGTCQLNLIPPQVLTCNFGQLAAGQSVTVQVSSPTTLATACATIDNTASVTTSNDGSGQASTSISVTCANISIAKAPVNATVSAGNNIAYDITVANNGLSAASNVVITDSLPDKPGLSWTITSITPVNISGSCQLNLTPPQALTCNFGQLAAGQSVTVRVSSPTTYASCGTISNTASVTTANDGSATTPKADIAVNCPALEVTKTPDTQTVNAGEPISFTVTVKNNGAGTAKNVTLSDQLPLGMTWIPNNSGCAVDANGLLTCGFNDLGPGESTYVTVTGNTIPAMCGTFDNTATIKLDNGPDVKSNTVSVTVNCADVAVSKEAITGTINAGDTAAFKIGITNPGAGTAYNVALTDTLPAGVAWTIDPAVTGCAITGNTLSCSFATLAAGAKVDIIVKGTAPTAVCGKLDNTATVTASNETNTNNNSASASITVNCSDVTVSKQAVASPINAGDTAAFKIVVSNSGAGTAYNVTVNDTLPAGITWTINPAVTGCAITGNTLSCSFATLAAGAKVEIFVSGATSAALCGKLDNTVTVAASNEANTGNNSASASITVNCADVTVIKAGNGPINAGDTASFLIKVTNAGAGTAYNVAVNDTLPAGITWTINPAVTGCAITGNTLSCSFATLAAGATVQIVVSGTAGPALCGKISNTVTVSAANESNTTNNSASAEIVIACPDVEVEKEGNGPISAGDQAIFWINVENLDVGVAYNVNVTDQLPAGVAWTIDPAVSACSIDANNKLTCHWDSLPTGVIVIKVTGMTSPANCGILNNTVTITASNEPASLSANNTASAKVVVNCPDLKVTKKAAKGTIHAGEDAVFDITVQNLGPDSYARNITLTDTLPGNLTWTLVKPTDGSCTITGNTLSCAWAKLDYLDPIQIEIKATTSIATCGTLPNTVTVAASNEKNTDTANNTSSATITVTCPLDLMVTKTADPAFKRTFAWDITKTVDKTLARLSSGSATFNYAVTVKETGFTDSDWIVKGKITVANPNSTTNIPLTGLTDTVNNGGTCTISGFTAGMTVPAGKSLVFDYTCAYTAKPTANSGINTVTATWDGSIGTPHGSATNTATFAFDTGAIGNPNNINQSVTVIDTFNGTTTMLGTATAVTSQPYTTKTFTYSRKISVPTTSSGGCKTTPVCASYTNTAMIKETGQKASQTVTVCGPIKTGALTIGYWQNKNGQGIIKNAGMINGVCKLTPWLRQFAPFQDLSATASCDKAASYIYNVIKAASAGGATMNAMLKAQMLATALDVYFSDPVLGGNKIGAPAPIGSVTINLTYISAGSNYLNVSAAFGGATSMKVIDMLKYAASKSNAGGSTWYNNVKSTQELAKDAFDAINNQWAFAP